MKTKLYVGCRAVLLPVLVCMFFHAFAVGTQQRPVIFRSYGHPEPPAQYGLQRLTEELGKKGIELKEAGSNMPATLLLGTYTGSNQIRKMVGSGQLDIKKSHESLTVKRITQNGREVIVIAGYDAAGLMYAILDLADAVEHAQTATDWPAQVPDRSESPRNSMRRMRVLMHHKANEDWYRSKEFWDWYLGMLATNRFNGLNLVYSHQTSYMAPMYAWHVKVDKFPGVRPTDITEEERQHNLEIMRYISRTCRDRGIELTIGVWQHMPWKESYLESREDQPSYVEGLDTSNVAEYTYLAVRKLLKECPGIARIQIRPNDESGIHFRDQTKFYRESVMKAIKDSHTGVKLDLRTVDVLPSTIEAARDAKLDVRTSIKFFGEFLGLPFTPQEVMTNGYSYSDYLEKPMPNPVYNEVWMLGSHRVLLWGSEDYGRRFGRNASYGGTIGFETDGPLAQKGFRDPYSPAWRIFKNKEDEYYKFEIERYWAFFRSVGRFAYNPDTDREVWLRPFRSRFGKSAEAVADAYEEASQVIGLICASHVSNINMYIWPEINMGGIIPVFNEIMGTDKGLFPSINQQIEDELEGKKTGRLGAFGLARKFDAIADSIEKDLSLVDPKSVSDAKELKATMDDFTILRYLASYHAHRQREGYLFAKYTATSDGSLLGPARQECLGAIESWDALTKIADGRYYDKLKTAMVENGHWKEKKFLIRSNLEIIDKAIALLRTYGVFDYGFDFGSPDKTRATAIFYPQASVNSYAVQQRFTGMNPENLYDVHRGFGFTQNKGLEYVDIADQQMGNLTGVQPDPSRPPLTELLSGDYVQSREPFRFRIDLLPLDTYHFTFVFGDRSDKPTDHGPFTLSKVGSTWNIQLLNNIRVPAGTEVVKTFSQRLREDWYPLWQFEIKPDTKESDGILSALTIHRDMPNMAHARPIRLSPEKGELLGVTISLPPHEDKEGKTLATSQGRLTQATLSYRTNPTGPFTTIPLSTDDSIVYHAQPRLDKEGVLQYYFQATGSNGRVSRLPNSSSAPNYYQVPVTHDTNAPTLNFEPVKQWTAGKPLPIEVRAADPSGVETVRVRFRKMVQTLAYESIVLQRNGDRFVGEIPGEAIVGNYDFVYYFEAVDGVGNGAIYPDWGKENPYIIVQIGKE